MAEKRELDPQDKRAERRQIDVTPIEVAGARYIIEFIAKVAVAAVGQEVKKKRHRTETNQDQAGISLLHVSLHGRPIKNEK